ncbi:MAG: AraC family transcriptional regulator [Clostridia bacterium]|nr:AraC family transcriptional regulator [Clostridia bacterium]
MQKYLEREEHISFDENYFTDVRLSFCCCHRYNPSESFGPVTTNRYVINIVEAGRGSLDMGNRRFSVVAGQAFVLFPGVSVSWKADGIEPWNYIGVELSGDGADQFIHQLGLSAQQPIINFAFPHKAMDMAYDLFVECGKKYKNQFTISGCFAGLLECVEESLVARKIPAKNFYMTRAVEYIKENYNQNLSVESIANMLGIERSYLSRLFKTYKNKSTQNYIIDYRISRAKKMFEEEDLNVSQVCTAVGYTNVYCFSRIFKSRVGMSPKEYREKCKRENIENSMN